MKALRKNFSPHINYLRSCGKLLIVPALDFHLILTRWAICLAIFLGLSEVVVVVRPPPPPPPSVRQSVLCLSAPVRPIVVVRPLPVRPVAA